MAARTHTVDDRAQARAEIFWRALAGHIAEATPRSAVRELHAGFGRRSHRTWRDDIGGAIAGAAFLWLLLLVT